MAEPSFDREQTFDKDYLYFYATVLTPERTREDVELIWKLLELEAGLEVLDLACGHGRIANALAERGCRVTGLDATPMFLDLARENAAARGVDVEYVEGDMRSLPWEGRFDRVLNWFTSFGYFDDMENRQVLAEACKALRPGGLLAVNMPNRDLLLRVLQDDIVTERDGDLMIDRHRLDLENGRLYDERTVIRGGERRTFEFFVRLLTPVELRDWMLAAGFREATVYGEDGEPITLDDRRMTVVGGK